MTRTNMWIETINATRPCRACQQHQTDNNDPVCFLVHTAEHLGIETGWYHLRCADMARTT